MTHTMFIMNIICMSMTAITSIMRLVMFVINKK